MFVKYTNGKEYYYAEDMTSTIIIQLSNGVKWYVSNDNHSLTVGRAIRAGRMIELFAVEDGFVPAAPYKLGIAFDAVCTSFSKNYGKPKCSEDDFNLHNKYVVFRIEDVNNLTGKEKKAFKTFARYIAINNLNNNRLLSNEKLMASAYDEGYKKGSTDKSNDASNFAVAVRKNVENKLNEAIQLLIDFEEEV